MVFQAGLYGTTYLNNDHQTKKHLRFSDVRCWKRSSLLCVKVLSTNGLTTVAKCILHCLESLCICLTPFVSSVNWRILAFQALISCLHTAAAGGVLCGNRVFNCQNVHPCIHLLNQEQKEKLCYLQQAENLSRGIWEWWNYSFLSTKWNWKKALKSNARC